MLQRAVGVGGRLRPCLSSVDSSVLQPAWESLRVSGGISSSPGHGSGRSTAGEAVAAAKAAASAPDAPDTPPSTSSSDSTAERVAKVIGHAFHKAPKDTSNALIRDLGDLDRIQLVLALQRYVAKQAQAKSETAYVEELIKKVGRSSNPQHSKLTDKQIASAVKYQRYLGRFEPAAPPQRPSWRQLGAIGLASGLPFVAFGFLDNGIMLVAGEQIDHLFGAKLGLTMMASAGLGNMVADVVGVTATHTIQDNMSRFMPPPRLSLLQQQMASVKTVQIGGAGLGVAIGCLLGMLPLAFQEPGFFVSAAGAAAEAATCAAAAGPGAEQAADPAAAAAATAAALAASAPDAAAAASSSLTAAASDQAPS